MRDYNRSNAVSYARRWALDRNPQYSNFDYLGGDCTNFASQCLYAGSMIMNYKRDTGWYYNSLKDRAAAWTGAEYFRRFLLSNKKAGPQAIETTLDNLMPGDFISLNNGFEYYHTLVVAEITDSSILICAHTDDSYMRPLYTYYYNSASPLHITDIGE